MTRLSFAELPLFVQGMSLASLFMGWVMVEEFEIDRHHWDRFLPLYRYGELCLYDLTAAALIVALAVVLRRRRPTARGATGAV